jgi:hypothetical protein
VWWKGASGDKVDVGPYSLDNAIADAAFEAQRGTLLYITDETGKRLTLGAARRLKAGTPPRRS